MNIRSAAYFLMTDAGKTLTRPWTGSILTTETTKNQQDDAVSCARLREGMTSCPSPVYLLYPPDRNGRRPSTHTMLQYASPADRASQESFRLRQLQEYERSATSSTRDAREPGHNTSIDISQPDDSAEYPQTSEDQAKKNMKTQHGQTRPPLSPKRYTRIWVCCQNCWAPGPYSSLYSQCIGCYTFKCANCIEEVISTQEALS